MVQIPSLNENQRLGRTSVSGFQDAGQARQRGQDISNFGRAVASAADDLFPVVTKDKTSQRLMLERIKNEARAEAARINSVFSTVGPELDGRTFTDEYERNMGKRKENLFKTIPEDIRGYADEVWESTRALESTKVYDAQAKQRVKNNDHLLKTSLGTYSVNTKADPDSFDKNFAEGSALIDDLIATGEMSPEFRESNVRFLQRQLSDAQIDGLVSDPQAPDNGSFNKAFSLLNQRRELYTPEEYDKKLKELTTQKYTVIDRMNKYEDRARKNKEEELARKTELKIASITSDIFQHQGDPVKMEVYKQQLMDELKKTNNFAIPKTMQALKLTEDVRDQAMLMEISNLLGTNPSQAKAKQIFNDVNYLMADGKLSPQRAKAMQDYVRNIMDRQKNDSRFSEKKKAVFDMIRRDFEVGDLQNLTDLDGNKRKDFLATVANVNLMIAQGADPIYAYNKTVGKNYEVMQRNRGTPGNFPAGPYTQKALVSLKDTADERMQIIRAREEGRLGKSLADKYLKDVYNREKILKAREETKNTEASEIINPITAPVNVPLMLQGTR